MTPTDRFKTWLAATYGTVQALSKAAAGVSGPDAFGDKTVRNWVNGRSEPGPESLRTLDALGCNILWLVTGKGDSMFSDTPTGRRFASKNQPAPDGVIEAQPPSKIDSLGDLVTAVERAVERGETIIARLRKGEGTKEHLGWTAQSLQDHVDWYKQEQKSLEMRMWTHERLLSSLPDFYDMLDGFEQTLASESAKPAKKKKKP